MRQLLVESLCLAGLGGVLGTFLVGMVAELPYHRQSLPVGRRKVSGTTTKFAVPATGGCALQRAGVTADERLSVAIGSTLPVGAV